MAGAKKKRAGKKASQKTSQKKSGTAKKKAAESHAQEQNAEVAETLQQAKEVEAAYTAHSKKRFGAKRPSSSVVSDVVASRKIAEMQELLENEMKKAQVRDIKTKAEEAADGSSALAQDDAKPHKETKAELEQKYAKQASSQTDRMLEEEVHYYQNKFKSIRREMAKVVVGQGDIIDALIEALLAKGHVLVEGVPGIAKTLIVRCMSIVTGSQFSRIQFTPDLLPSDIVGVNTYEEGRGFYTLKGPIFANYVLADEINRAPPKVQSALLEAMQEKQVTIGRESFLLPKPFFVMATQNPVENLGTYPLPEAQVDRFLFKLLMTYPAPEEELEIMHKNMSLHRIEDFNLKAVLDPESILQAQIDVQKIYLDPKIEQYIVRIVEASRNPKKYNIDSGKYLEYGASPRSTISLFISSKAHALIKGRTYVIPQDVKEVAKRVLRHRVIMNYEGQAENISSDIVVNEILKRVPIVEPKLV